MRWLCLFFVAAGCGPSSGTPHPVPDMKVIDPNADNDGDGFTTAQGDCNDGDKTVYPGAAELCDGKDHNCNHEVDDPCDDDMDGYAIEASDKHPGGDCNDMDPLINPGAFDYVGNMVDDNCNGMVDEPPEPCTANGNDALAHARSLDLCPPWLSSAQLNIDADPAAYKVRVGYGKYVPHKGADMLALATGIVADENDNAFVSPQPGTAFHNNDPNPLPSMKKNACYTGADEVLVHDYVELAVTMKVPTNAKSFSFQFNFLSAEYPEYVGTQYNDKFLAILDSQSYQGNVSFDKNGNPVTVNVAFFDVCDTADICNGQQQNVCSRNANELQGTGYEQNDQNGLRIGGGTGWLTTTAPVTPGETATLRFILFDEGDHLFDSAVLIDNFQWQLEPASGPSTVG